MDLYKEFSFEAAHFLPNVPADHKCHRMHGHSFRVKIHVSGTLDQHLGWVIDFATISAALKPVLLQLDHRLLNDTVGLENPTSEHIAIWIWNQVETSLSGLNAVEVCETCTSGCRYQGSAHAEKEEPNTPKAAGTENTALPSVDPAAYAAADASSIDRKDLVTPIFKALNNWQPKSTDIPTIVGLTARSLDTVTKLTQYEDEKANRLLTAIAFLSAFVGALFTTIPNRFPTASIGLLWGIGMHIRSFILATVYFSFLTYAVLVAIGAAFTIWAVMPRFKTSKNWKSTREPKSFLFFERIAEMNPAYWGEAFANRSGDELNLDYAKQSIAETYLISNKIGDKVGWLKIGVRFFFAAAIVVALFVVLTVITLVFTPVPAAQNHSRTTRDQQAQATHDQPAASENYISRPNTNPHSKP